MYTLPSNNTTSLVVYEAGAEAIYTLDEISDLTGVSRRTILLCSRAGLVSPVDEPETAGWRFDQEAVRTLRRIEHLRASCGANLSGIKLILGLMDEVEQLRAHLRFQR